MCKVTVQVPVFGVLTTLSNIYEGMFDKFLNTSLALMFTFQIEQRTQIFEIHKKLYQVHLLLVKYFTLQLAITSRL